MDPEFTEMCWAFGIDPRMIQAAYQTREDRIVAEEMAGFDIELPVVLEGKWPS